MTDAVAPDSAATKVERVFRTAYSQAVATLVRVFGDITLAEDAVQDAFVVATARWRSHGIPPNPAGWIVTTAPIARSIDSDGIRGVASSMSSGPSWNSPPRRRTILRCTTTNSV